MHIRSFSEGVSANSLFFQIQKEMPTGGREAQWAWLGDTACVNYLCCWARFSDSGFSESFKLLTIEDKKLLFFVIRPETLYFFFRDPIVLIGAVNTTEAPAVLILRKYHKKELHWFSSFHDLI